MERSRMTFFQGVRSGFGGLFRFSGRARRMELFSFGLVVTIPWMAVMIWLLTLGEAVPQAVMAGLLGLYAFLMLAVLWRRCQDVGQEGYIVFVLYAALYGIAQDFGFEGAKLLQLMLTGIAGLALFKLMQDSHPAANAYGPSPKYQG
ncbi:DUF805 domain-containing protein [Porphyromonas levii]|uniref:DUF805 domain-containing protein n=2 Tax=Porphyromonas levii TaxID=28114 RepID=UPI001BA4B665|nr:DUF805 domain-containing protein [Porphyromonas levii]MBR8702827.1 hypothetical protein [Porphyromonas levii]MBR8765420.1 hypothetical protein [Porphyromonas levii]MBR8802308.1 hypothetical protein [Porphyromonas levii]MBR8805947.1 hypothetical protein [Porphyromonas levii]